MSDWTIRRATVADADAIVDMRVAFLTELAEVTDEDALRKSVRAHLERTLLTGEVVAWVAETDGGVVGTVVVTIYERMMWSGVGREGYVLNMYTTPGWRERGIGSAIVDAMLAFAREQDIKLALIATEAGDPVYARAGFEPDPRYRRWRP